MDTPNPMRRVTRSQTSSLYQTKAKTISVRKYESLLKKTQDSGEALLRRQPKILLETIEEEQEVVNNLSSSRRAPFLPFSGILPISPAFRAATTPPNAPSKAKEEAGEDADNGVVMGDVIMDAESVNHEEDLELSEWVAKVFESPRNRAQFCFEYFDDNSSSWSTQANASASKDDEDCDEAEYFKHFDEEDLDYYRENIDGYFDELCEQLGRTTRFIYSSDGEMEREEEIGRACSAGKAPSPSVKLLKGLPLPEGKHLRFQEEDEE